MQIENKISIVPLKRKTPKICTLILTLVTFVIHILLVDLEFRGCGIGRK